MGGDSGIRIHAVKRRDLDLRQLVHADSSSPMPLTLEEIEEIQASLPARTVEAAATVSLALRHACSCLGVVAGCS